MKALVVITRAEQAGEATVTTIRSVREGTLLALAQVAAAVVTMVGVMVVAAAERRVKS